MNFLDHIINFLLNGNHRLSTKASFIVITIVSIFLLDNIFGFSFNYYHTKKIENIRNLNLILNDTSIDSQTRHFALNTRREIIQHNNIFQKLQAYSREWFAEPYKRQQTIEETDGQEKSLRKNKNSFWFHVTAGGFYYLLAILMLPILIFTNKESSIFQRLAMAILSSIAFGGLGIFFYWICSLIPQLMSTSWWPNYVMNLIIQFFIIGILIKLGSRKSQ